MSVAEGHSGGAERGKEREAALARAKMERRSTSKTSKHTSCCFRCYREAATCCARVKRQVKAAAIVKETGRLLPVMSLFTI